MRAVTTVVWWIRRDLRLADNQALDAALDAGQRVVPVFVLDESLLQSSYVGDKRLAFLLEGLRRLDGNLRERGSRLIVRQGDPVRELERLVDETGAVAAFAQDDRSPYAGQRDERLQDTLPLHLTAGLTVHPPEAIQKRGGGPYVVYSPFRRAWRALPPPRGGDLLPAPERLPAVPDLKSLPIPRQPALPAAVPFVPGEAEASRRLEAFVSGEQPAIYAYGEGRDRLDLDGTSGLSHYLRFGMISARQAVVAARRAIEAAPDEAARTGADTWLDELVWREFYFSILHHFPRVREGAFRANLAAIAWQDDEASFEAWCQGRTGYPVVDAAMRQLVRTGWMHNRARMIVASFLVKDLLIDWRRGERFFMQHLVDGDPAANNGGWQWVAGTGTDAAPYFRIFNPTLQGKKHDPQGHFVRRWLPALQGVPDRYVHTPWEMPPEVQEAAGCFLDRDYPLPIVDHARARERTLEAYRQAREEYAS
jgi:deoxyribodipyrimidine photo-lyase